MTGDPHRHALREILIRRVGADAAEALLALCDAPDGTGLVLEGLPIRVAPERPAAPPAPPTDGPDTGEATRVL